MTNYGASIHDLVVRESRRRRFARGEVLFHQGDLGGEFHVLERGHVAVRVGTPLGDTATVRVLGPGDAFGELALLSDTRRRIATAVALDAVETRSIDHHQFQDLRSTHPEIDSFLIAVLANAVERDNALLLEALYSPVDKRVRRRLLDLVDCFASETDTVVIPVSQDLLAGMAGTARQTANRVLQDLQARGVIECRRGAIEVHQLETLRTESR